MIPSSSEITKGRGMSLFKYFSEERFVIALIRNGAMRFGSLSHYRGLEGGGVRGDAKDGTLHYAPDQGIEITMVEDGRKLHGTSFSTAAQGMFVFCASTQISAELAAEFGRFCVGITEPAAIVTRLKRRECRTSRLDYANIIHGDVEYRSLNKIPGIDWAFPERVALIKPPEYFRQSEFRIALPTRADATSSDAYVDLEIGSLKALTHLHCF